MRRLSDLVILAPALIHGLLRIVPVRTHLGYLPRRIYLAVARVFAWRSDADDAAIQNIWRWRRLCARALRGGRRRVSRPRHREGRVRAPRREHDCRGESTQFQRLAKRLAIRPGSVHRISPITNCESLTDVFCPIYRHFDLPLRSGSGRRNPMRGRWNLRGQGYGRINAPLPAIEFGNGASSSGRNNRGNPGRLHFCAVRNHNCRTTPRADAARFFLRGSR